MGPQKRQVYMLRFPNGKVYVGTTYDVFQRWASSGAHYKGMVVGDAIEEFGWENVKKDIVFQLPEGEESTLLCEEIESKLIRMYEHKSYNERGTKRYNRRISEKHKASGRIYDKVQIPVNGELRTLESLTEEYGADKVRVVREILYKYDVTIEEAFALPKKPKEVRGFRHRHDYWKSLGYSIRETTKEERAILNPRIKSPGHIWKQAHELRGEGIRW